MTVSGDRAQPGGNGVEEVEDVAGTERVEEHRLVGQRSGEDDPVNSALRGSGFPWKRQRLPWFTALRSRRKKSNSGRCWLKKLLRRKASPTSEMAAMNCERVKSVWCSSASRNRMICKPSTV